MSILCYLVSPLSFSILLFTSSPSSLFSSLHVLSFLSSLRQENPNQAILEYLYFTPDRE